MKDGNKIQDEGNCGVARLGGKEAYVKLASLRTERCYKADGVDELAQHGEVCGSTPEVKHQVVQGRFMCLPREASLCARAQALALSSERGIGNSEESAETIVGWSNEPGVVGHTVGVGRRYREGLTPCEGLNLSSGNNRRWL